MGLSKFNTFLKDWGVLSSPHYPQNNGKAESTIKSIKQLIKAAWKCCSIDQNTLARYLLQYRNTPCRRYGTSPAQKLYGHPIQNSLPAHRRSFAPEWQRPIDTQHAKDVLQKAESFYDKHAHPLPDLALGAHVAIQNPTSKVWHHHGCESTPSVFHSHPIWPSVGSQPPFYPQADCSLSPCTRSTGTSTTGTAAAWTTPSPRPSMLWTREPPPC